MRRSAIWPNCRMTPIAAERPKTTGSHPQELFGAHQRAHNGLEHANSDGLIAVLLDWFQMNTAHSHYDRFPSLPETRWYRDAVLRGVLLTSLRLEPGMAVLDIGCGAGTLVHDLAAAGHRAVGVDCSRVMVTLAERRVHRLVNASLVCGKYEHHADGLGRFDRVVCKNILHLVPDVETFLQEIHRSLSPGGFLVVVETVSPTSQANQFVRSLFGAAGLAGIKSHFFIRNSFSGILERAGYATEAEGLHSQTLYLEEWLRAKRVRQSRCLAASALVAGACRAVKTVMGIRKVEAGGVEDWALRRLQFVATIRPRARMYACPRATWDTATVVESRFVGAVGA